MLDSVSEIREQSGDVVLDVEHATASDHVPEPRVHARRRHGAAVGP